MDTRVVVAHELAGAWGILPVDTSVADYTS